jgi:hypothetical protein
LLGSVADGDVLDEGEDGVVLPPEADGVADDGVADDDDDDGSDVTAWLVEPVDSPLLAGAELVVLELDGEFGSPPFTRACAEQPTLNAAVAPITTRTAHICSLFMAGPRALLEPSMPIADNRVDNPRSADRVTADASRDR